MKPMGLISVLVLKKEKEKDGLFFFFSLPKLRIVPSCEKKTLCIYDLNRASPNMYDN